MDFFIESQVKPFATFGDFPAVGQVKTIYIDEATSEQYYWNGLAYISLSGDLTGLVPYTGATGNVDLGTHTLSAKNIIVNHASGSGVAVSITKGGAGEALTITKTSGSGNAMSVTGGNVQFGTGFFWDSTNNRLGIGGTPGAFTLDVNGTARVKTDLKIETATGGLTIEGDAGGYPTLKINTLRSGATRRNWMFATEQFSAGDFVFYRSATGGGVASTPVYSIFNNGNIAINTTTDAGFRLDVNGTIRSQFDATIGIGTSGARRDLNFNVSFPGAGTRGGIVWSSGASILNRRKNPGGNDNTISFLVANNSVELLTIQEHNGTINTSNVGIGNSNPDASAKLDVVSTTQGFLPPRMTTTQRNAIASPAAGLIVYDTTLNLPHFFNGTIWVSL
jgi:hypothetical protein